VSIAYERRGRFELAVVYDALKRELFVTAHGRGARLNGRPIHVSTTQSLDRALLATAFPYDQRERRNFYLTFWEAFMMRTQGVRHTGSAVLTSATSPAGGLTRCGNSGCGRGMSRRAR
jgi:myo-inositol-1(or 4)-monophosphatase